MIWTSVEINVYIPSWFLDPKTVSLWKQNTNHHIKKFTIPPIITLGLCTTAYTLNEHTGSHKPESFSLFLEHSQLLNLFW